MTWSPSGGPSSLESLDTPGHTMSHVCLLSRTDQPALFCGDTLFNAGAGNCHNGGHPSELYDTFADQIANLDDGTLIYPGHDYITNNLEFTLDREPDNARAKTLLDDIRGQDPHAPLVTSLGLEKEVNSFFRLRSASVIARLRGVVSRLGRRAEPARGLYQTPRAAQQLVGNSLTRGERQDGVKQRAFGVLKTVENIEVMAVLDDQQLGVETGGAPNFVIVAALPDETRRSRRRRPRWRFSAPPPG